MDALHPPSKRRPVGWVARAWLLTMWAAMASSTLPAHAERADRSKPLTLESQGGGAYDVRRGVMVYQGNVVIQQGTMNIRAERIELRELSDRRVASAIGAAGKPAGFRQKREGLNETLEGSAERIEYDDKTETVRFIGSAAVRRLRGTAVADEVTGAVITYDNRNEVFSVDGSVPSTASTTSGTPPPASTGRTRVVLSPRQRDGDDAAGGSPAAPTPSSPASAPAR